MPRQRIGLYDQYHRARQEKLAAMTPEQRAAARQAEKAKALLPVRCAPVKGDPFAIDWEYHECGYVPLTDKNGKPRPKSGPNAERAWRWTEEPGTAGRPCLRSSVNDLALTVYRIGFRHNPLELHSEGGFPDDMYWGPHGPGLIIRELKPMQPGDVRETFADITAIERDLGYHPMTTIDEGVPRFVSWFRNYHGV